MAVLFFKVQIMKLYYLTILLLLSTAIWKSPISAFNKSQANGIYVYKYQILDKKSGKLVNLLPDDSIFYSSGYAIEKITSSDDVNFAGISETIENTKGYYFIDFTEKNFFESDSLHQLQNLKSPTWNSLLNKKFGLQLFFKYYDGEKYHSKDTLIQSEPHKVIWFISSQPQLKDVKFTFLLKKDKSAPPINYNIEEHFNSNIKKIIAVYPSNQGNVYISIKSTYMDRQHQMQTIIDNICQKYRLHKEPKH